MKTNLKKTVYVLLRFMIVLFVLEITGFAFLCLIDKKVASLSDIAKEQHALLDHDADLFNLLNRVHPELIPDFLQSLRVHPYLGFTLEDHLFYQDVDRQLPFLDHWYEMNPVGDNEIPFSRDHNSNQYLVGITGGSVAQLFFLRGTTSLRQHLLKNEALKNKDVQFIDLTVHGYKQPQQLMALNYFLAMGGQMQMLINIDGFNEITLGVTENMVKNVNPVYPRGWYFISQSLSDRSTLTGAGMMMDILHRSKGVTACCSAFPLRHSYTAALFWKLYVTKAGHRIADIQRGMMGVDAGKLVAETLENYRDLKSSMEDDLENIWKQCSVQMDIICRGNGIRYYHFLQPNQYYPGSKRLTREEHDLGISYPYAALVSASYPALIEKGAELVDEGVCFSDMTMVFAETDETLYTDSCCHFNKIGDEILAQAIGRVIAEDLSQSEINDLATNRTRFD